jgi:hypothetical protein
MKNPIMASDSFVLICFSFPTDLLLGKKEKEKKKRKKKKPASYSCPYLPQIPVPTL